MTWNCTIKNERAQGITENGAKHGAPKYMEWYAAFGLMVTLIWSVVEHTEYREREMVIMALHIMDINIAA